MLSFLILYFLSEDYNLLLSFKAHNHILAQDYKFHIPLFSPGKSYWLYTLTTGSHCNSFIVTFIHYTVTFPSECGQCIYIDIEVLFFLFQKEFIPAILNNLISQLPI